MRQVLHLELTWNTGKLYFQKVGVAGTVRTMPSSPILWYPILCNVFLATSKLKAEEVGPRKDGCLGDWKSDYVSIIHSHNATTTPCSNLKVRVTVLLQEFSRGWEEKQQWIHTGRYLANGDIGGRGPCWDIDTWEGVRPGTASSPPSCCCPMLGRKLLRFAYKLSTCSCKELICAVICRNSSESLKPPEQQFGAYWHSRLRLPQRKQGVSPLHLIFRRLHSLLGVRQWCNAILNGPGS